MTRRPSSASRGRSASSTSTTSTRPCGMKARSPAPRSRARSASVTPGAPSARAAAPASATADDQGTSQVDGSVSVLTPLGLGATVSGGQQWRDLAGTGHTTTNNTRYNMTPALFYTTKLNELGNTTLEFAFEYCNHCNTELQEQRRQGPFAAAVAAGRQRGRRLLPHLPLLRRQHRGVRPGYRRAVLLRWRLPPALLIGRALV